MENKRGRNWRATYLTIDTFEKWRKNEWCHFKRYTDLRLNFILVFLALVLGLMAILIGKI